MTTLLAAVRTVHECAVVCDALADRDDVERVVGVGVAPGGDPRATRDAGEALNVLAVRLPRVDVETEQRRGAPAEVALAAADDHGVDEVVVAEGFDGVDELAAGSDRPVDVVDDPV